MSQSRVLFVCIHNSARSQMAEAFLNQSGHDQFIAESAGLEPGQLNPVVVEVMQEIGIDIAHNTTQSVDDVLKSGRLFDYVITVCDAASGERCPVFPGPAVKRLHWGVDDPGALQGTLAEKRSRTRHIRDAIKHQIEVFINDQKSDGLILC